MLKIMNRFLFPADPGQNQRAVRLVSKLLGRACKHPGPKCLDGKRPCHGPWHCALSIGKLSFGKLSFGKLSILLSLRRVRPRRGGKGPECRAADLLSSRCPVGPIRCRSRAVLHLHSSRRRGRRGRAVGGGVHRHVVRHERFVPEGDSWLCCKQSVRNRKMLACRDR